MILFKPSRPPNLIQNSIAKNRAASRDTLISNTLLDDSTEAIFAIFNTRKSISLSSGSQYNRMASIGGRAIRMRSMKLGDAELLNTLLGKRR